MTLLFNLFPSLFFSFFICQIHFIICLINRRTLLFGMMFRRTGSVSLTFSIVQNFFGVRSCRVFFFLLYFSNFFLFRIFRRWFSHILGHFLH
eukprot:UN04513